MPPFEEEGAYRVAHVGRYVSLNLVQLITQERFKLGRLIVFDE